MKYGLPRVAGPALQRLVGQMQTAVAVGEGKIVLFTFKEPAAAELALVVESLGINTANSIQFVHGFRGLVQWFRLYFM
ncbi:MAG: hypothetical protein IPK22_19490 [Verrucomicrobiaceae bacterium]|nr:hypothetical protein [Verrucomicrobiaceae bacterium]